jgi:hypothetical protein
MPEDVAGIGTYDIVRQIRCESRESVKEIVVGYMGVLARAGDPAAQRFLARYEVDPEAIATFHPNLFAGKVRDTVSLFYDTGIAYSFELAMSEDNDLTTDISLLKPLTQPKFTLGISAGAKRKRSNNRQFTVTDTFSHLLTRLNTPVRGKHYCDGQIAYANYIYPIAGRIGVDKLIKDFIELTLFGNLAGKGADPGAGGLPTMVDKLTFTTVINASATPKLEFTPIGQNLQLANASVTGSAVRADVHQVAVGLAIAKGDLMALDPLRSFLFSSERGARVAGAPDTVVRRRSLSSLVVGRRVIGGGTPSEILAVLAIDQIKSREFEFIPIP